LNIEREALIKKETEEMKNKTIITGEDKTEQRKNRETKVLK